MQRRPEPRASIAEERRQGGRRRGAGSGSRVRCAAERGTTPALAALALAAAASLGCRWIEENTGITLTTRGKLEKECARGLVESCYGVAQEVERTGGSQEEVETLLADACQRGSDRACDESLAALKARGGQASAATLRTAEERCSGVAGETWCLAGYDAVEKTDPARAGKIAADGCQRGVARLCAVRANEEMAKTIPDDTVLRPALEKACKGDFLDACGVLSTLQAAGRGGPRDLPGAARSARAGCKHSARHCWNAAEFNELIAWDECRGKLGRADASKVRATAPTLEQSEETLTTEYTTPTRYETHIRERGIFFPEMYLETTAIPGRTYQYLETKVARYAYAAVVVENGGCAPTNVALEATFSFNVGDALARGAGGAVLGLLAAAAAGAGDQETKEMMLAGAGAGAGTGLTGKATVLVPAGESQVVYVQADTQSLFGRNRKMESVKVDSLEVSFPEGEICKAECLAPLVRLTGTHADVREMYERACREGGASGACAYVHAIDDSNDRSGLVQACNGNKAPNFEGACRRLEVLDWL